jgi:signal transduction histidine kinase
VAEALLAESTVSARRLSEIVGAVGRYSHLGEAPVGDVDLRAGLEDTLTVLLTRLSGVRVEADLASDLPPVEGHAGELNQVWTILIDNALDAMTEARGGEVGDGAELGRLWLATRRAGDGRVAVEVRDDGPGIPAELRRSIFDPYFTTKPVGSGTGLGLHIARQIVERHGGEIEVESSGDGTRFRVLLPVVG